MGVMTVKTANGTYTIDSSNKIIVGDDIGTCGYKKMIVITGMPGIVYLDDDTILNTGNVVSVM